MLTILWSWLGARVATLASLLGQPRDSSPSSTFQGYGRSAAACLQSDPIAILEVRDADLDAALDSEALFYEVTDVETATKHANAVPAGRYVVFRDTSGRILLQDSGRCLSPGASSSLRRKLGRF